jgi:hypothetical protein
MKKVELAKKNKEFSGSLLKFLTKNEDACFNNKGLGDIKEDSPRD